MSLVTAQAHAAAVANRAETTTTTKVEHNPPGYNAKVIRAGAEQAWKHKGIKEKFVDFETFAAVCDRDERARLQALADQAPPAPKPMASLVEDWNNQWDKNVGNCQANFTDKDVFIRANRVAQKTDDRRRNIHRQ